MTSHFFSDSCSAVFSRLSEAFGGRSISGSTRRCLDTSCHLPGGSLRALRASASTSKPCFHDLLDACRPPRLSCGGASRSHRTFTTQVHPLRPVKVSQGARAGRWGACRWGVALCPALAMAVRDRPRRRALAQVEKLKSYDREARPKRVPGPMWAWLAGLDEGLPIGLALRFAAKHQLSSLQADQEICCTLHSEVDSRCFT